MITLGFVAIVLAVFGFVCLVLSVVLQQFSRTARDLDMPSMIPAWVVKLCYGAWLASWAGAAVTLGLLIVKAVRQ